MIALDTNIVVRLLVADEPNQHRRAAALLDGNRVFVSVSVLLETEWVLRSVYGLDGHAVAGGLRSFLGLPAVTAEASGNVVQALAWYEQGFDFADAFHLASAAAAGAEAFATFDRRLRRLTDEHAAIEVIEP